MSEEKLKLSRKKERLTRNQEEKRLKRSDERAELTETTETIKSFSSALKASINHLIFTS